MSLITLPKEPRRVVITGAGGITSIGNDWTTIEANLRAGVSGIGPNEEMADRRFSSQISGILVDPDLTEYGLDRKAARSMGAESRYAYAAAQQAIIQAGSKDLIQLPSCGLLVGSGGPDTSAIQKASNVVDGNIGVTEGKPKKAPPMTVPLSMSSTTQANLAVALKMKKAFPGFSSACATSLHTIGEAAIAIATGRVECALAGGGEGIYPQTSSGFDVVALSRSFNDTPDKASRPYDRDRDGFVVSGGAGMVFMETLESAIARDATILAEVVGYGVCSDGYHMTDPHPEGEGAIRCMEEALAGIDLATVSYINTHGTSTPTGDIPELLALEKIFGGREKVPGLNSTKSLTGHGLGAAGAQEALFCLVAMVGGFIPKAINIENLDDAAQGFDIVTDERACDHDVVLTTNFGFGGTNGALALKRYAA